MGSEVDHPLEGFDLVLLEGDSAQIGGLGYFKVNPVLVDVVGILLDLHLRLHFLLEDLQFHEHGLTAAGFLHLIRINYGPSYYLNRLYASPG